MFLLLKVNFCRKITKFLRHTQVFVQFICISQNFVVILHPQTHAGVSAWMSQGEGADII